MTEWFKCSVSHLALCQAISVEVKKTNKNNFWEAITSVEITY